MMKAFRRISFKLLAVFLSVLMVLMSFPLSVLAQGVSDELVKATDSAIGIIEIEDARTADTKRFRLEDGTYMVAQYDTAVHYLDETNTWQDIDNTLTASGSEITTENAKIKFAKKTTGNNSLFTLHDGNRKLTLSLNGAAKKVSGVITNHESPLGDDATELQKMTVLHKIMASVIYEDILSGVDLEYVIIGNNIKENIIVKEKQDFYAYTFTMSLNNLMPVLDTTGEIALCDPENGACIWHIPAPVMWDASKQYSNAIEITLTDLGNGKFELTLVADSEWMNDEERTFPVTIDPPIYTNHTRVKDIYISGDGSSPDPDVLKAGTEEISYWIQTDLPEIPESAYITEAQFTLASASTAANYIGVYAVESDWDETLVWIHHVTGELKGALAATYTDYAYVQAKQDYTWNITPIVKKWYQTGNYGLAFTAIPQSDTSQTTKFYSSESTEVGAKKPKLCICYQDMKGVEDYWSFTSQSVGFAGSGAVNNATGNLVFSIPTLTSTDALMPYTPSLVYNSALAGKSYNNPNAQISYMGATAAKGFKQNNHETLLEKSYPSEAGGTIKYFIWADGDGTEHYFMPTGESSGVRYFEDEDGLQLKLEVSGLSSKIIDSGHNVRHFKRLSSSPAGSYSGWYLSALEDQSGNSLIFATDSADSHRVTSLELKPNGFADDSKIEQMCLFYNSAGILGGVWNPASKEAAIFRYTSDGYLCQMVRVHSELAFTKDELQDFQNGTSIVDTGKFKVDAVANYTYDDAGRLLSVTNELSRYRINYAYDSTGRVISVQERSIAGSGTNGQQISLTYGATYTEIRTSGSDDVFGNADDLITTYSFDTQGRCVSCYTTDLTKTKLYGASNGEYVSDEENAKAKNNLKSSVQTTEVGANYLLNGGFENTATANLSFWSTQGSVSQDSFVPYEGIGCAHLTVDSVTSRSAISQSVSLPQGEYCLAVSVLAWKIPNAKLYLKVQSNDFPNNSAHSFSQEIAKSEYMSSSVYSFASLNFESVPMNGSDSESFTVTVEIVGAVTAEEGAWIDNVVLTPTLGPADQNLLEMGHFESVSASQTVGDFWSRWWDEEINLVDSGIPAFGRVLKIESGFGDSESNSTSEELYIYNQTTPPMITEAQKASYTDEYYSPDVSYLFTVSAFGKGTVQAYNEDALFGLRVTLNYFNGTADGDSEEFFFSFDKSVADWQFLSGAVQSDPTKGLLESVTVSVCYTNHPGVGYFENVALRFNDSESAVYSYNAETGKIEYSRQGKQESLCWYNDAGDLVETMDYQNNIVQYTYDDCHRVGVQKTYIYRGVAGSLLLVMGYMTANNLLPSQYFLSNIEENGTAYYWYNDYGLLTESGYMEGANASGSSSFTLTQATYNTAAGSHIFGVLLTETDNVEGVTRYFYDENTGRLNAVTYPTGDGVAYSYDGMGNLTQVLPAKLTSNAASYTNETDAESVSYTYDSVTNRLTQISTESTTYHFTYDGFGNTTSISAGANTLASYEYHPSNGKLSVLTYGNGLKVKYLYDSLDRISEICYNTGIGGAYETVYRYTYDASGNLCAVEDLASGEVTSYRYDTAGNLVQYNVYDAQTYVTLTGADYYYDGQQRLSFSMVGLDYRVGSTYADDCITYSYTYNYKNQLSQVELESDYQSGTIQLAYDGLHRLATRTVNLKVNGTSAFTQSFTYDYTSNDGAESYQVSQVVSTVGTASTTYRYTYDANGNITQIADADGTIQYRYEYDNLGQLKREDNRPQNKTFVYTYDNAGNRTSRKAYFMTMTDTFGRLLNTETYSYGGMMGDQLTSIGGDIFEYDAIGNPTRYGYYDTSSPFLWDSGVEMTWEGRQMQTFRRFYTSYDVETELAYYNQLAFTYNADGIRTSKTVDGVKHTYVLEGSQILAETWEKNGVQYYLVYLYDESGAPIGMKYRTSAYAEDVFDCFFFEKNLQGDIIAVYNSSGTPICTYKYDAWGAFTTTVTSGVTSLERSVANTYNPFRYRGYFYDVESGYYYLQSRYYNPNWGRFLNADGYVSTGTGLLGFNMYAYCNNNPISYRDSTGEFLVATIVGGIIGAFGGAISAMASGDSITAGIVTGFVTGAAIGYICDSVAGSIATAGAATGLYLAGGALACGLVASTLNFVNQTWNYLEDRSQHQNNGARMESFGEYIDVRSIVISGITSAATSFLAVGAGVIVNSAFADLADDSIKLFANGVADAIIGGNASLLSTGIDWITQRVAKGGELE